MEGLTDLCISALKDKDAPRGSHHWPKVFVLFLGSSKGQCSGKPWAGSPLGLRFYRKQRLLRCVSDFPIVTAAWVEAACLMGTKHLGESE